MINVGLLITGNEILSSKTKDTNGPFMGMNLRKIGVSVRSSMMCSDNETDILDCLNYLANRCDVILMTGGLGPTSDDLTAEIVAKFLKVKTIFYEKAWANCLQAYKKLNRVDIPESNKKQAFLPEGSTILANKIGTAVGFKVNGPIRQYPLSPHTRTQIDSEVLIYCMPGVPYEMEAMFLKEVYPELSNKNFQPVTKTWQVFLMGESSMQTAIERFEKKLQQRFPSSSISYQAHPGFVTYSVSLFPNSEEQFHYCQKILENEYTQAVQTCFHKYILYSQDTPLSQFVIESLRIKRRTLSIVEASCGGVLTKEISVIRHAEDVMMGSVIMQGNRQKRAALTNSVWDDLPKIKQLEFMKSDITLAEWGAPALEMATDDLPHGFFNIMLSINPKKIKYESALQEKLESVHWKKDLDFNSNERINYMYELNVSTRYNKEVQQTRVAMHCLCTLALIVEFL